MAQDDGGVHAGAAARRDADRADGEATARPRTTAQVFDDHLALREAGDLEADLARNYAPDVVLLTLTGVFRGHDGVRAAAEQLKHHLPNGGFEYKVRLVDGETAFLAWEGCSSAGDVHDGADSFVIRDGRIAVQTIHYHVSRPSIRDA